MNKWLPRLQSKIDALTLRERVLTFLSGIAVLFMSWSILMFAPQHEKREALNLQMQSIQQKLDAQTQEVTVLARLADGGTGAEKRRQLAKLKKESAMLDKLLSELAVGMVRPEELLSVLKDVLQQSSKLVIKRIESLPIEELKLTSVSQSGGTEISGILKHTVVLSLEGSYFALLKYLQGLELLPWHFYWDSLSFRVSGYPLGDIELRVSTLSMEEALLEN